MLDEIDYVPAGFLTASARQIASVFKLPTLMHLAGRRQPAVFVSILLHGNEDVGLLAMQQILKSYRDRELPRSLICFVGNVDACASGVRFKPGQVDFNRGAALSRQGKAFSSEVRS